MILTLRILDTTLSSVLTKSSIILHCTTVHAVIVACAGRVAKGENGMKEKGDREWAANLWPKIF
jgi:hypothetical protein